MDKIGVNFMLSANAAGMAAGMKQASAQLDEVAKSAQATSGEYRKAARITAELQTPTEKYAKEVATLDSYLLRGLLTQEIYNRAIEKAKVNFETASESASNFTSGMSDAAKSADAASQATDTASGSIEQSSNALEEFVNSIAIATAEWKLFTLGIKSLPAVLATYGVGVVQAAGVTRLLMVAVKGAGISIALFGGSLGILSSAALILSNPLLGAALLTFNLVRSFLAAREAAHATALAVGEMTAEAEKLGVSLQDVQIAKLLEAGVAREDILQLGAALSGLEVQQFGKLAASMEELDAAGVRSATAFDTFARVLATPFVGAFAAIKSGFATLNDGMTDLMAGINSILMPIMQALAPIVTLFGTIISIVLKTIGVIGSIVGVVMRVAGVFLGSLLAPVIVGLTYFANAIQNGVVFAFEAIGATIDWLHGKIDDLLNFLANIPIIGMAFARNEVAPDNSVSVAKMKEEEEAVKSINEAIERQHALLSTAIDSSTKFGQAGFDAALQYQESLKELDRQLEAGILNETSYARAAAGVADAYKEQTNAIEARNKAAADLIAEDAKGEQANQNAISKQTDAFFKLTKAAEDLGSAGTDAALQYQNALIELNRQLVDGMINEESYARAASLVTDAYNEQTKAIEDRNKAAAELVAEDAKTEQDNQNATTKQTDAFFEATKDIEKFGAAGADAAAQYQSGLMDLNEQLRSGMINQETFNRKAKEMGDRFDQQKAHLQEVAEIEKKAAEAEQFRMDNIEALGRKSGNALQANDVRSSEGIAQVIALTVGREDPAIAEARKQTQKLNEIKLELALLNLAGVDILGAAA